MKKGLFLFLIVLYLPLFGDDLALNGDGFGLKETKKGYLDFYLINEDGKQFSILDSGLLLNSRIFIKDSDRRFYLREQGKYVISISGDTLLIKWRIHTLEILEKYRKIPTGFIYDIEVKNRTDANRNVGIYLMYDTYLGEADNNHFLIDDFKSINKERTFYGNEIPKSVKSLNLRGQGIEFRLVDNNGYKPEQLILGNWDRLAHSKKWPYKPKDGGFFSFGYYSINDSGLGIVYPSVNINPKDSIHYIFHINFIHENKLISTESEDDSVNNPKKWSIEKKQIEDMSESFSNPVENESTIPVEKILNAENDVYSEVEIVEQNHIGLLEDSIIDKETLKAVDPEQEELLKMLEYIRKKKRGEDVSEYGFNEDYILKKLKERNE